MFLADLQQAYTESTDNEDDIVWKHNSSANDLTSLVNSNHDNTNNGNSNTVNTSDDFLLVLEGMFKFDKSKLFSATLSSNACLSDIKWRPSNFPIAEMMITLTSDNVAKVWLVSRFSPIHAGTITTTNNSLTGGYSRIFHGIHGYVTEAKVLQELTLQSSLYTNPTYRIAWINHGMSSSSEALLHAYYSGSKVSSSGSPGGCLVCCIHCRGYL